MTAGQVSDYTGAAALLDSLSMAQWMLADRGYDVTGSRMPWKKKGSGLHSGTEIPQETDKIRQVEI